MRYTFNRFRSGFVCMLAGALCVSVLSARGAERPNILWIVAEDISPLFGCYGNPDARTPNIDRFAKKSYLFENAYATAPICAPSRSSLATGMYAQSLGTQNLRSVVEIPEEIEPLARTFRENGYWTALRGKTDYNFDPEGLFDYWKQDTAPWEHCPEGVPFFAFMNLGSTHEGSGNLSERANRSLGRLDERMRRDPERVQLPPYFPDTPEMRRIWARYHDLISVFDLDVKAVLDKLEASGRADDTIVFLMADHGLGLPRYKRWLYRTGLRVPLIIHVPKRFESFFPGGKAHFREDAMVSYIDLPATALAFADIEIPEHYHGRPLFERKASSIYKRDYVFGARDRADDMYDLSRCVIDGRYIYIRHYQPHLPPIQQGVIFNPYKKESLIELHRARDAGTGTEISSRLWERRPFEELYDLEQDPWELENLADRPELAGKKSELASVLRNWILDIRDSAFLPEAEMHRRANAAGLTPYEMLQSELLYPLKGILEAAEKASKGEAVPGGLASPDPAARYWTVMSAIISEEDRPREIALCLDGLDDPNPIVRATAAEGCARAGREDAAIPVFRALLRETEPNLALHVARSLAISMDDVGPLEQEIRAARERYLAPPGSERPWKDFFYSAFTTWALEWALIKSGLNDYEDFEWWQ